jgi:type IV secretory pathway TrbD component
MTSIFDITACSVCMGAGKDHIGSVAAGYAMLVMLLIILPMLGSIIFFVARMARRETANLDPSLCD